MTKNSKTSPGEVSSNKVFQVLMCLETHDRKRLLKYLNSPYFNQSKTLIRLCELLIAQIESGKEGFVRKDIWKTIFPKQEYDDVNFRKYCSDLLKQIEGFMAQEVYDNDENEKSIDLLSFISRRNITPLRNSALRSVEQESGNRGFNSSNYFIDFQIEKVKYSLKGFDRRSRDDRVNIEDISKYLDYFYLIEKLRLFCSAYSEKRWIDHDFTEMSEDIVLEHLKNINLENVPELATYFYAFQILKHEENLDNFINLKTYLTTFAHKMPHDEAIELFESAINYCIGKANKGHLEFLEHHFDLVKIALDSNIFLVDGELKEWRFNNIIGAALRLGRLDWAEEFIVKHRDFLPVKSRENTYTFNLARVYRYQQKFDKVLSLLRNVEYEDIGYNLISKAMLIITYYEMDELDALDSFIESFRVFLNRHKNIPAQRRKSYLNLIKYVRRLTRLMPGDKNGVEKLRQEIIREKATTVNHEWLLEKLAEMD